MHQLLEWSRRTIIRYDSSRNKRHSHHINNRKTQAASAVALAVVAAAAVAVGTAATAAAATARTKGKNCDEFVFTCYFVHDILFTTQKGTALNKSGSLINFTMVFNHFQLHSHVGDHCAQSFYSASY